uniref:SH3 domain protein n=1 Tax=Musca domestica TaxID=7370 RepID=T1P7K5_MUSDO
MDPASYGTLPLLRSVDSSPRIMGGGGHNSSASHGGSFYERIDKLVVSQDPNGGPTTAGHHIIPAMTTFGHKRSPSGESLNRNLHLAGAKLVLPPAGEIPTLKHVDKSALSRPKIPPPGPPAEREISNGQSNESISSIDEGPIAPPRKLMNQSTNYTEYESWNTDMDSSGGGLDHSAESNLSSSDNDRINSSPDNLLKGPCSSSGVGGGGCGGLSICGGSSSGSGVSGSVLTATTGGNKYNYAGHRRCRALYDCSADNDDELEFKEGEVLIVLNERTDDENWMEGVIEGDPSRRGMFPVSFVHMLPD